MRKTPLNRTFKPKKVTPGICPEKATGCRGEFFRFSSFTKHCSNPACVRQKIERDEEEKAGKLDIRLSPAGQKKKNPGGAITGQLKRARQQAQRFARIRDRRDFIDKDLPPTCISCGTTTTRLYHGGHFISVGSCPELQFHPGNINLQCEECNIYPNESTPIIYRENLITKIGLPLVLYLENYHELVRWSSEDIEAIRIHFRDLVGELENIA